MSRIPALLVTIALLATQRPAAAQGFRLGGGLNLSDFFGDDVGETERKSGLDLGLSLPLLRFGPAQIRAEGYYRQKGARSVEEFQQAALAGESVAIGIDYVEAPILLRLGLPGLARAIFPYVEAGPAFAWRINCGVSVDATTGTSENDCDDLSGENIEETLKDYEQGLVLGGGFDIPVFRIGSINIDARYTRGLSRIAEDGEIRNRALSVMLGYSFGLPYGFPSAGSPLPGMR